MAIPPTTVVPDSTDPLPRAFRLLARALRHKRPAPEGFLDLADTLDEMGRLLEGGEGSAFSSFGRTVLGQTLGRKGEIRVKWRVDGRSFRGVQREIKPVIGKVALSPEDARHLKRIRELKAEKEATQP